MMEIYWLILIAGFLGFVLGVFFRWIYLLLRSRFDGSYRISKLMEEERRREGNIVVISRKGGTKMDIYKVTGEKGLERYAFYLSAKEILRLIFMKKVEIVDRDDATYSIKRK